MYDLLKMKKLFLLILLTLVIGMSGCRGNGKQKESLNSDKQTAYLFATPV